MRRGYDEGEGCGFDNLDMSAYAERIFRCELALEEALAWFSESLLGMGWKPVERRHTVRVFRRGFDESIQVQILPKQESREWSWSRYYGRPGPFARISYRVQAEETEGTAGASPL